jgi:hypothetical protein
MLSDAAIRALRDIAYYIDLATNFVMGFDYGFKRRMSVL